jgi:Flp pilus assembly protein TadG
LPQGTIGPFKDFNIKLMTTSASHLAVSGGRHHRRNRANRCGTALLEFALILPVLVTIVLAAVDFGRFAHSHIAVTNSARVGAGYACMHPYTNGTQALWQSKIRDAVKKEMQGVVNYDDNLLTMTTPQVTTDSDGQKRVRIEIKYPFHTLVNWSLIPNSFLMTRAVEMRFMR